MSAPESDNVVDSAPAVNLSGNESPTFRPTVDVTSLGTQESVNDTATTSQTKNTSKDKSCGVCNDQEARYKCPRCQLPYCSVSCATLHKATHSAADEVETPKVTAEAEQLSTNVLKLKNTPGSSSTAGFRNTFSILDHSTELQSLFILYPCLRSQLRDIYQATLPPTNDSGGSAGQYEFQNHTHRGKGRSRGRPGRGPQNGPWNTDRGIQDGIDALCTAKEQYDKNGEGVREYAKLVLRLVSMEGVDVARLVQEEVAEDNAKIIAQLLSGDSF